MENSFLDPPVLSQEWWRVTLSSIGDGVIATDPSGRITFLNPVAEQLTGWSQADAFGRQLTDVFNIVNETSGVGVDDPVTRVLKSGSVVGLANHTVLVDRNGRRIPIDDSAAPIRRPNGELAGVVLIFRDVTERRRTELGQAYLSSIVESSFDAIIGKDLNGVITSWNPAAQRIFGYSKDEVVGKPITIIIPPERLPEEAEILARLRRGDRTEHFDTIRIRKDGTPVHISLTVSPIVHSGTIIGASKIARDITQRKEAERERERLLESERLARAKAEEANRLKDEFLATVSHELRTPLSSIMGWSVLLSEGKVRPEHVKTAVETITRNARAQAKLIEDLLDVSRIVTGKIRLEIRPVMAASVVESALAAVKHTAEVKGIVLETVLDRVAGPVSADAARLQQVVWNLLNNAIKFTPGGGRIEVQVKRVDGGVEIVVSDTGQGIDGDFLPHVFDRFRQAESSATRTHGGLGLGLAIVRHLVELHGGTVAAASDGPGHGATFTVRLPLLQDTLGQESAGAYASTDVQAPGVSWVPDLRGVKVLIIDDDDDARKFLRFAVEQVGAEVRDAHSAQDGLQQAKEWKPSIILADIGMPGEDGYQFIKDLRDWEQDSATWIPAVALTAYARAEDRVQAMAAGYQIHIAKPIDAAELVLVIASQLGFGNPHADARS